MAGLEGQTLDRYELEQLTGRGGMADVYRAFDPKFERSVAVKIFKRDDEELLRRFVREARMMASLNNPHLVQVYDTGSSPIDGVTYYFIVMPFMQGGSLRARIRRNPLPLPLACRYLSEIADALDYIHSRGIIHRDIKSSNVLLDEEGNSYVSDFGIARQESDATQATSTGNVLGTVDYIAPELFESNQHASVSSDLYSLAVLAFEMVTGRLPFAAENQIAVATMHVNKQPPLPRTFVPNLPLSAERVLLRGLEKRPESRYQSATDFAEAFCQAISSRATVEIPAEPMWDWDDRTQQVNNQEAPLVLPPVLPAPPVPPAPLSYGNYGSQQPHVTANLQPQAGYPGQQDMQAGYRANQGYPVFPVPPVSQQGIPAERRAGRTRLIVVSVVALLLLLVVIGPLVYLSFTHSPLGTTAPTPTATTVPGGKTPTPNLTGTAQVLAQATSTQQAKNATATAQANATQQAEKNATATAVEGATATAQANASATPGVIQTATAGTPLYQDALNNANNATTQAAQWDQNNNCTFKSDGYHVTASNNVLGSGQFVGCHEAANQYQNMAISVDMTIISGHSGGLFFRLGIDSQALGAYSGYLFEVDNAGRYKVSSSANYSTGSGNKTLQDWTKSSAIKMGSSATNTLQVIANNSTLNFYINGTFLVSLQDSGYTSGDVGFLATTTSNGSNADIVYSNLSVYTYPPAK